MSHTTLIIFYHASMLALKYHVLPNITYTLVATNVMLRSLDCIQGSINVQLCFPKTFSKKYLGSPLLWAILLEEYLTTNARTMDHYSHFLRYSWRWLLLWAIWSSPKWPASKIFSKSSTLNYTFSPVGERIIIACKCTSHPSNIKSWLGLD